ncbi:hypothetical protein KsCSTR_33460 [Candidatus Kuenenia stuttgartiensis]|uniref:Uncharacterized protein n=1 Tax=Kuenenia stuttgartiensis TaxID=174633 RepID=A0A6G7GT86_KUEST|nr:hypothetical protein KsCSTR_33460 [Candidatus Kuenenia stuttgartiensis]
MYSMYCVSFLVTIRGIDLFSEITWFRQNGFVLSFFHKQP